MSLKKETIEKLAALTKVPVDKIEAAIKDTNEVDLEIPEGLSAFTEEDLTTLKDNSYKKGQGAAVEIAVKDLKKELGLEFEGKTVKGLVEAAQKKAVEDAKVSPDKKVTELTEKLNTVTATATELQTKLAEKDKAIAEIQLSGKLVKEAPEGLTLDADDVFTLMKSKGYGFELKDGTLVAMKDGKVLEDKLAKPVPVKDVVTEFAKERKLITEEGKPPAGRGGAGSGAGGGKVTKLSELREQFKKEGKSELGSEFRAAVEKAQKDFPEFDLNG